MLGILTGWRYVRTGALLALLCGSLLPGCMARTPDGMACEQDKDCHSGYCSGNFCAGTSSCKSDNDCETGWKCKSYISIINSIGNYFGDNSHSTICAATCGYCPVNEHCASGVAMDLCQAGSMLTVSAGDSYEATVNEPVTLSATAQSSAEVVSFSWSVGAATPLTGATVTYTFSQVEDTQISVTVTDSTHNVATAEASVAVRVGAGGTCSQNLKCRSSLTCQGGVCM